MKNINCLIEIIKCYNMTLTSKVLLHNINDEILKYELRKDHHEVVEIESINDLTVNKKYTTIIAKNNDIKYLKDFVELLDYNGFIVIEGDEFDRNLYKLLKSNSMTVYTYSVMDNKKILYYIGIKSERELLNNHISMQASVYDDYIENYDDDMNFLKEWIKNKKKILEIGVGTGRLALELSKNKEIYYGIDYSPSMLKILEEKNKTLQRPLILKNQNMLDFNLDTQFDAIIYPFRVFSYCKNKNEISKTLKNAKKHLKDEHSRILINMLNFDKDYIKNWDNKIYKYSFLRNSGAVWTKLDYMKFYKTQNLMYREITILNEFNELVIKTEDSLLWLSMEELCDICKYLGFKIHNIWPAYKFEIYSGEFEYIISIGM